MKALVFDQALHADLVESTQKVFAAYIDLPVRPAEDLKNEICESWIVVSMAMKQQSGNGDNSANTVLFLDIPAPAFGPIVQKKFNVKIENGSSAEVAAELINCIFGLAKARFNARGYQFEMSLPKILSANARDPGQFHCASKIQILFTSPVGGIRVSVGLENPLGFGRGDRI